MMSYAKVALVFTLISVSISFVLFLFLGSLNPGIRSFKVIGKDQGGVTKSPGTFQKLAGNFSKILGAQTPEKEEVGQNSIGQNLTELFAKKIAAKIIDKNPEGAREIDGELSLVMSGGLNFDELDLDQELVILNNQVESPVINGKKFNIKETTKKEDLTTYILLINSSYVELFKNSGFGGEAETKTKTNILKNFDALGRVSEAYLKALHDIEVPAVFEEFHKKLVAVMENQKNIADKFLEYKDDPLREILTLGLQRNLNNEYKKLMKEEVVLINKYELPVQVIKTLIPK